MYFIKKYRYLILLLFVYFLFRLFFLTRLPIFNDESIYLHWGWKELRISFPNFLFLSLFDGKQPLLMWIFGIAESFIPDPLLAGRLVSVMAGMFTLLGIYTIGKDYFNSKVGIIASLIYCVVPLFTFYDRQALMESSVAAIGVWICYFTISYIKNPKKLTILLLGIIFGVGLFIKTTPIVFILSFFIMYLFLYLKTKKLHYIYALLFSIILSQIILLPIYNQFDSIKILLFNKRYSLSIFEILQFPVGFWFKSIVDVFETLFFHLTPVLFSLGAFGVYSVFRKRTSTEKYTAFFLLTSLVIFIISIRSVNTRYVVPFIPLVTIFIAYSIEQLWKKPLNKIIILFGVAISIACSFYLIYAPSSYLLTLQKITKFSNGEYIHGFTSGFGIIETKNTLLNLSANKYTHIEVRGDSGNPEDAMFIYLKDFPNIHVTYLDMECRGGRAFFKGYLKNVPTYFVTRDNRIEDLGKCISQIKKIYKPDGNNYIGIYKANV